MRITRNFSLGTNWFDANTNVGGRFMKLTNVMFMISDKNSTKIISFDNQQYVVNQSCESILKTCCLNYGTTLEGTTKAIRHHLNIRQKCPILLSAKHQLMFFPIPLVQNQQKLWIRYLPSLTSKRISNHQCVISFAHKNITLEVDNRMVIRQIKRCQSYIDKLNTYDLEYGLFCTEESVVHIEDLLSNTISLRKGFS